MNELTDTGSLHSLPTVVVPRAPTLPVLLAEQVRVDSRLAHIERGMWYLLALFIAQEILIVAIVGGVVLSDWTRTLVDAATTCDSFSVVSIGAALGG